MPASDKNSLYHVFDEHRKAIDKKYQVCLSNEQFFSRHQQRIANYNEEVMLAAFDF